MHLSYREWWALIHGIIFGAFFLLAFSGGLAGLWSLRAEWVTTEGLRERVRRLKIGTVVMALAAWGTVITGTWIVYPWYRSTSPDSPKSTLTADPSTADWHEFGMEWKEHVAWLVPLAVTSAAYIVQVYGRRLSDLPMLRRAVMALLVVSFSAAAVAGTFGAFINKVAATR